MPEDPVAADETVRFRGDSPDARPPVDAARHAAGSGRRPLDSGRSAANTRSADTSAPPSGPDPRPSGPVTGPAADSAPHDAPGAAHDAAAEVDAAPAPAAAPAPRQPEIDDTRPVTRDWLRGAPAAGEPDRADPAVPEAVTAGPGTPVDDRPADAYSDQDDVGTQKFDMTEPPPRATALPERGEGREAEQDIGSPAGTGDAVRRPPGPGSRPPGPREPWWRRRATLLPVGAAAVLAAAYGVDLGAAQGSIPRSTVVAGVDIGGLSPAGAAETLQRELTPVLTADRTVVADDVETTVSPAAAGLTLDVDRTVDAADDQPLNPWTRFVTLFAEREVQPVIASDDTALAASVENVAAQVDRPPVDATISFEGTTPSVVDSSDGRALDRDGAADALTGALASGRDPGLPIELPVEITPVRVERGEAERVLEETVRPAVSAPVALVSQDGATSTEVPVAAIAASLTFTPQQDGELRVGIDPAALQSALGEELAAFGTPAKDADFQISGGAVTVIPSVDGTGVDPARLAEQLLPVLTAPAPRSITAELGPVPADFTTEEAQALGIKEEISSFTTRFTSPASGTNIRVVAAEVDGALVMPGETFSLNTFTGPRGTAQGYVEAAVIQNGELSKAVGGGISQFATTMFNAVFFAGLEDVYHKPHTFYISRYPAGREATVYEGAIDLQWRNDSDTGVYIDTHWTPGSITVTFYGTKRYEIQAIESARTNYREPTRQDRIDDGNCTPQPGIPGFDVTVTRVFRDLASGAELRRETFQTRYAAEAIINCIPPDQATPTSASPTPSG